MKQIDGFEVSTKHAGAEWLQCRVDYPLSPLAQKVAGIMGEVFGGLYNWENCGKYVGWRSESQILFPLNFRLTTGNFCPSLTALVLLCHKYGIEASLVPDSNEAPCLRFVNAPEQLGVADLLTAME